MEQHHFPTFYEKNVKRIYRFLYYRVGGDKQMAQDLTQDVFLKAFQAFDRYDEKVSASAWIFTIARNHLLNQLAKKKPQVSLEEIENTTWDREDWASRAELTFDQKRMLDAMKQLPADDAALLRRKHLEGWSFEEIATEMGKTPGALRVQAHRAIKELRRILKKR